MTDDDRNLREPVPLTDMPGSWRTFAIWAVILVATVILFSVAAHWFWSEFVSEAVRAVSGEGL